MNMDVTSVGRVDRSAGRQQPPAAPRTTPLPAAAAPADSVAIAVAIPAAPPQEVLDAMHAASRAYEVLHEQGRELRFVQDADTGVLSIQVWDLDGNLLANIPPSKLLDVAMRGTLHP